MPIGAIGMGTRRTVPARKAGRMAITVPLTETVVFGMRAVEQ